MKLNKYSLLLISILAFISFGFILFYKYLKAEEFSNINGGLQAGYAALNLEIINIIYTPVVIIIHIFLLLVFKSKDKNKKMQSIDR